MCPVPVYPASAGSPVQGSLETDARLLQAAGEVFAERGFREATVREICTRAGANVAAVNYHFGDKEGLYRRVLAFSGRMALEKYPIGAAEPSNATPEERLRVFVRNYVDRLLDEGRPAWHGKLIARELFDPTPAFDELVEGFVRPQYERLRLIVADLLGPAASEDRLRRCVCSVVGQCLFYKHCRPVVARLMPGMVHDEAGRNVLAAHITTVALGGIAAVRAEAGARGRG
ncbi:MAG: CerR family C-terminal domain-containing protein [Phycisphaerales bacterium]